MSLFRNIEEALVLFDALEEERDDRDEEKLKREDRKVQDIRYLRERTKLEVERGKKDLKNRQVKLKDIK